MSSFGTLPFEAQLARVAELAQSDRDPLPLLREAGASPDAEPFALLLDALAEAGRIDDALELEVGALLALLSDAALQHVLSRDAPPVIAALLERRIEDALHRWPIERIGALAFAARWLRRRAPEAWARVLREAELALDGEPDDAAAHWLLFASGPRLGALLDHPRWSELVRATAARAIDVLARAPKSISQANAEKLLAERVYADPGHFFFELLQNADDAGASRWSVAIDPARVVVRHDGAPFSFLDLVGVLSIGQTTKRAEQIGFFGVGFKSVYEICERPRVRSGAFAFEIAHVSIPRALGPSEDERPSDARETVLALPLARGRRLDVRALHARAASVPPETLMTLGHVRTLRVEGEGEGLTWREDREPMPAGEVITLSREGTRERRRYRSVARTLRFAGPREQGRADESAVLVAARVDELDAPAPIEGPTIYAFLPTNERSGLRVLVHARFDVTLDRERLELGSAWNDALLAEAGDALGELVEALASEGADVLPVLSAPDELAPSVAPLIQRLTRRVADVPCLPGASGERLAPSRARLLDAPLMRALAGVDLGDGTYALGRARREAIGVELATPTTALDHSAFHAGEPREATRAVDSVTNVSSVFHASDSIAGADPLDARERAIALALGARPFDAEALHRFLIANLAIGAPPPRWLGHAVLDALDPIDDASVRALPLLVDGAGRLVSAELARSATDVWALLYAGERPLVARDHLDALPSALGARLAIEPFDPSELVSDLSDSTRRDRLLAREELLFTALADLAPAALAAIDDVPLLPIAGRDRRACARDAWRLDASLAPLADVLAPHVPLIPLSFAARHAPLLARFTRTLDLEELAHAIEQGLELDDRTLALLCDRLDELATTLVPRVLRRLGALPIVADRHGARRALLGPSRALRPFGLDPDLLPEWPWITEPARAFVEAVDPPRVDARAIASALAGDGGLPPISAARLEAVQSWLAGHAGDLPSALVDRLAAAPIWRDTGGVPRALDVLRRGTPSAAIDAAYAAIGGRFVAAEHALRFARALGIDSRLPANDHAALIGDLVRMGTIVADDGLRTILAAAIEEAATVLRAHELASLTSIALFADEQGTLRRLASWEAPDPSACHRAGAFRVVLATGPWPLVSERDEALFARLLARVGPLPASPSDVVRHASELIGDPRGLLAFVEANAAALDEDARTALAALPIFESGAGTRAAAGALAMRAPLAEALGEERVRRLGIDDALFARDVERLVARLDLPHRSTRELLEERVLVALVQGAPLAAQREPWRSPEDLVRLARLVVRAGLDPARAPLAIDAKGRLVRGPCRDASEAARRLVAALPMADSLAHPEWAAALRASLDPSALLSRSSARHVAEALREACPDEAPRDDHAVVRDVDALYAWLRESADELASDEAAKGALAGAAVLPSQRGTLRAPRDLVLSSDLPDLGLGWGLAPDVPADVARWLRATFEIDRHARRALVSHVLDGIDEAAKNDDADRASALARFLARALGAGEVDDATLEERVRRLDVRARLKVPVEASERVWEKPRFAWMPADAVAEEAERFALDLPPRIALPDADLPTRRLLAACGAASDLDDRAVMACLDGALREGAAARRALARYVAVRALSTPSRIDRWKLATRAWVPTTDGALHRSAELVWPDALARSLFGEDAPIFPDPEVIHDLDADLSIARIGFRRASNLELTEVASHVHGEAHPALLDWLEQELARDRFDAVEVRRALRDRLVLRDDEGTPRSVTALARSGARALFGDRRGDWSAAREHPRLARALGVPSKPDAAMITAYLVELGSALGELRASERDALTHRVPACLEALARHRSAQLPVGAAIAGLHGGRAVLARIGDPALCMLEPPAIADALGASALETWIEPLPTDRDGALVQLLLRAGVPDLLPLLDVDEVVGGPRRGDLDERAEALRASLAPLLPKIGARARVHDSLALRGAIRSASSSGYRGAARVEATVPVDAAIGDGTLVLTPLALDEPERIAAAIARDPVERAALASWLADRSAPLPKQTKDTRPAQTVETDDSREGFFARMRRLFVSEPARRERPPTATRPSEPEAARPRDEAFFRPEAELGAQLDRTDGWLAARREAPTYGFAFTPRKLGSPWVYAPKLVAVRFDQRWQSWQPALLTRPEARGDAGMLVLRGKLPAGEAVLPVPLYGRLVELRVDRADARPIEATSGALVLRLDEPADVRARIVLGRPPSLEQARPANAPSALVSFVPDAELPDEVHDALASLDEDAPAITRALALRDFVRERYRYDPTYLEDPSVGRWLARVTRGRANAHVAALHAAGDARHLGAGVCYELNALACELLRRAGIPAALATGWVLDGGQLSEPDHLWALALLEDASGAPAWVPIDASTTKDGRPLRVPRRPPGRFRVPEDGSAREPDAPRWDGMERRSTKKKPPPRAELRKVLYHLEKLADRPLDEDERRELERALTDRDAALLLLDRLRRG